MYKLEKCLVFLVCCWIGLGFGGSLWPYPSHVTFGSDTYSIDPKNISFNVASNVSSAVLKNAIQRYQQIIFYKPATQNTQFAAIYNFNIVIDSNNETLYLGMDESYALTVASPNCFLAAKTVWGALRGLETFSQLVDYNFGAQYYSISQGPIIIEDEPRFSHRGLLIDTARHYLPVPTILRALDAMSYNKLNVLHWHIVDAESFPFASESAPKLSQGAWDPSMIYTKNDVQNIIEYAFNLGIRVIVEVDTPGHSASWRSGYPSITAKCPDYSGNLNNIPLNPTLDLTKNIVSALWNELAELFPDEYVHIGGDEVVFGCWKEDATITQWMQQHNVQSYTQLMSIYETFLWNTVQAAGKQMIGWQELFSYGLNLPPSIVIDVWKDQPTLFSVANAGYRTLLSYGWYLYRTDLTWQNFYNNEPFSNPGWTPQTESLVIGGEASAWGEYCNQFNFDQVVWPKTSATAERLWSPASINDPNAAQPRLIDHICRMNRRGISANPLKPGFCLL